MHVLVVSDNLLAAAALSQILKAAGVIPDVFARAHREGHAPAWPHSANSHDSAWLSAGSPRPANVEDDPAAIVLDCNRPACTGACPLRPFRALGPGPPVLVLAGPGTDEAHCLTIADEYIAQPYKPLVLRTRFQRMVHRFVLEVADLRFDCRTRQAHRGTATLPLTPGQASLLELLMRNAGQTCRRAEILAALGCVGDPGTKIVEVNIKRLRDIVDAGFVPQLIHNVRGEGYQLTAEDG